MTPGDLTTTEEVRLRAGYERRLRPMLTRMLANEWGLAGDEPETIVCTRASERGAIFELKARRLFIKVLNPPRDADHQDSRRVAWDIERQAMDANISPEVRRTVDRKDRAWGVLDGPFREETAFTVTVYPLVIHTSGEIYDHDGFQKPESMPWDLAQQFGQRIGTLALLSPPANEPTVAPRLAHKLAYTLGLALSADHPSFTALPLAQQLRMQHLYYRLLDECPPRAKDISVRTIPDRSCHNFMIVRGDVLLNDFEDSRVMSISSLLQNACIGLPQLRAADNTEFVEDNARLRIFAGFLDVTRDKPDLWWAGIGTLIDHWKLATNFPHKPVDPARVGEINDGVMDILAGSLEFYLVRHQSLVL